MWHSLVFLFHFIAFCLLSTHLKLLHPVFLWSAYMLVSLWESPTWIMIHDDYSQGLAAHALRFSCWLWFGLLRTYVNYYFLWLWKHYFSVSLGGGENRWNYPTVLSFCETIYILAALAYSTFAPAQWSENADWTLAQSAFGNPSPAESWNCASAAFCGKCGGRCCGLASVGTTWPHLHTYFVARWCHVTGQKWAIIYTLY